MSWQSYCELFWAFQLREKASDPHHTSPAQWMLSWWRVLTSQFLIVLAEDWFCSDRTANREHSKLE
jgi:hypothetical protein